MLSSQGELLNPPSVTRGQRSPPLPPGAAGGPCLASEWSSATAKRLSHALSCAGRLLTAANALVLQRRGLKSKDRPPSGVTGAGLRGGRDPGAGGGLLVAGPRRRGRAEVPGGADLAGPRTLRAVGAPAAGAGSRARARAPPSPAAAASPSLGSPSGGRYLPSPGRAPSRLPAGPGPPRRRAAPALSAAPASERGPRGRRGGGRGGAAPSAGPGPARPSPAAPLGRAAGRASPRGIASENFLSDLFFP